MVASSQRPVVQLVLLILCIYIGLFHDYVNCWSIFGSTTEEDDNANLNADDSSNPTKANSRRSLSSFQKEYSHTIPKDQPITPRGRRDIEASVKAHMWPTTIFSPLCEAWAYLDAGESIGGKTKSQSSSSQNIETEGGGNDNNYSLAWRYLDILVEQGGIPTLDSWVIYDVDGNTKQFEWTFQNSTNIALDVASRAATKASGSDVSTSLDTNLLPMSLSLRAHSPHCEMHRSLARDAAISFGIYNVDKGVVGRPLPSAFIVLSRVGKDDSGVDIVLGTQLILDASLLSVAIDALKNSPEDDMKDMMENAVSKSILMQLPDETFHPKPYESVDDIVAILYGQVGTTAFAALYKSLKYSQINFVVRHMGYIRYEEKIQKNEDISLRATPTSLQGYGVRLDIRNLEYKAFDESSDDKDGDSELDVLDSEHHPDHPARNEYLGGVNLDTILGRLQDVNDDPLPSDLQSLQTALIHSHPTQLSSESIVPPAWQRRPLSLQAATVIALSSDPLETLKGVSQNLPSVAHSLANVKVPESFEALAEETSSLATKVGAVSPGWGDAAFGLYINSSPVDVERPSFNVFQLLDVLRAEDKRLRELEQKIRPTLKDSLSMLRGERNEPVDDLDALKAVRKIFDMGTEELVQMGKKGLFNDEDLVHEPDNESGLGEEESSSQERFRVDVGRGGKNAILYLNDIEKDPAFRSWPTSIQEMMYRSQFGGAPTVRRNLFTLLVVFDPTSGSSPATFNVIGQLLNSQFPLRLGVLIVNNEDVSKGGASAPESWNNGDRNFNARDAFLLLQHISKKYGGMAAISCLIQVSNDIAELGGGMSVKEYVGSHVSLMMDMGAISNGQNVQNEMEALLEQGNSDISKDINYEAAVQFAVDKLIQPGMSFLNGLPLPDDSNMEAFGAGVNEILSYENNSIMKLVMKGVITDTAPRSIYATVLKGDKVYKQFHPLLKESGAGQYTVVAPTSTWHSLILPTPAIVPLDYHKVDAIFVVEGVFDLDTDVGIEAASSFLKLMSAPPETWHDSKSTSVAFRILPSFGSLMPRSQVLASILCVASQFDLGDINKLMDALSRDETSYESVADVVASIGQIKDISTNVLQLMVDAAKEEHECPAATPHEEKNFYTANGRKYVPIGKDASITISDINMLINMEMDRTYAMTQLILPHLLSGSSEKGEASFGLVLHQAIGTSAAILNEMMSTSSSSSKIQDIATTFESLQSNDNPLYFNWNDDDSSASHLQVKVSVILDPLTEPTQRVAPLLLAIRDVLKLPLRMVIAPRKVVNNDVPLSSYYRFVADSTALPDSNPPTALFKNLPTNHVLTLRMDVPEIWDVQQARAIQDSDNLRCDPSTGCGDEGGGDQGGIEKATIEYGLKSLLFFGQCYDVKKSSPPNGLKLTLDRLATNDISTMSQTASAELQPDGTQLLTNSDQVIKSQDEHTDTLVMKTVGYWQLRANPGVWDLRIAENSRGAEIYNMVEGTVSKRGKIKLAKNTTSSYSKKLVMKDFTNQGRLLLVNRKKGYEDASLFSEEDDLAITQDKEQNETVHIFSLATGHAYERLLKIMM